MDQNDQLDATFSALAHPIRRAILARLANGPATVNELAEPFSTSLPAISQHIRVLENADLIERGRKAQFRPCTLNAKPLADISNWTNQYRDIWEDRFDILSAALQNMKENEDE